MSANAVCFSTAVRGPSSAFSGTKFLVCFDKSGFLFSNNFLVAWLAASVTKSLPRFGPLGGSFNGGS